MTPTQGDLFQSHSETSRAAARSVRPHVPTQKERVLAFLRDFGPATDERVQQSLGLTGNAERPRRISLQADGLVFDTGRTERTSSGRLAVVWAATPARAL